MTVSYQHEQYRQNIGTWAMVRDCVDGARSVKGRREVYLPKPCPEDVSTENALRYDDYLKRANFVNFTGSTLYGLIGLAFRKEPNIELSAITEYLREDATGNGLPLEQLAKSVVSNVLETGRHGLLVDYPEAPEGLTAQEIVEINLAAVVCEYPAESVINWRTSKVGASNKLSLVVLAEPHEKIDSDGFGSDTVTYHRVLRLVDGLYQVELYDEKDTLVDVSEPRKADGSRWTEIPFVFVGSLNNDEACDDAPLADIAGVNIAHYRNSADFEESCFMVGQPTPVAAGLSQSWVNEAMKGGVVLGSRRVLMLPEGGSASLLQANPNQMPELGMQKKEAQMVMLGARIIQDNAGTETAEAARIRFAGQTSRLANIVGNVEAAINRCLYWFGEFMGQAGDSMIEMSREFYDRNIDPQMLMAKIALLDRGVIAKADVRGLLRVANVIDAERTDEMIDGEVEQDAGLGDSDTFA